MSGSQWVSELWLWAHGVCISHVDTVTAWHYCLSRSAATGRKEVSIRSWVIPLYWLKFFLGVECRGSVGVATCQWASESPGGPSMIPQAPPPVSPGQGLRMCMSGQCQCCGAANPGTHSEHPGMEVLRAWALKPTRPDLNPDSRTSSPGKRFDLSTVPFSLV